MKKFIDVPRKHDAALILGCGPSINLLKKNSTIKADTFAINNFYIHDWFAPDYMMCELKMIDYRIKFFKEELVRKEQLLKDTAFLLGPDKSLSKYIPKSINRLEVPIEGYNPCRPHATYSLGKILSIVNGKQYKTIYMLGIDLHSSEYFWSGKEGLPDFIQVSNFERNYTIDSVHRTATEGVLTKLMPYIKQNNINVVNLSPKSLLKNHMPTMDISCLLNTAT